jgi:predicted DNA-binding antitoxin AbrB/MazE fold protein
MDAGLCWPNLLCLAWFCILVTIHWGQSTSTGTIVMAITVEAVYENGVLKPSQPLPWKDGDRVRVAVSSLDSPILKAYGIMGFKGTAEEAEYFALHPDLLPEESR